MRASGAADTAGVTTSPNLHPFTFSTTTTLSRLQETRLGTSRTVKGGKKLAALVGIPAAATSSMDDVDMVLKMKRAPAFWAAEAVAHSP